MNQDDKMHRQPEGLRRVHAGQIELNVIDRGSGMPVLFVHGFPLDQAMWEAQISSVSRRRRAIAPDLRGFGTSQVVPGTASMEQMAEDLDRMVDALAIREPIVLCGLSMGGYVAFQFWRKYASRLRGLVLCDTRAVADTPEGAAARHAMVEQMLHSGPDVVAQAMLPRLFARQTAQEHPELMERWLQKIRATAPEGMAAALRGMAGRPDVRNDLPRIEVPTLVIVGEHDAISTVDEMRAMAEAIPGSQCVVIPNSGHVTSLENPAAFNAALESFLERLEAGD